MEKGKLFVISGPSGVGKRNDLQAHIGSNRNAVFSIDDDEKTA